MRAAHVRNGGERFKDAGVRGKEDDPDRESVRVIVLQTTLPDADRAGSLARACVEERLAACVQATPIRSTYRWEGRTEEASEVRLDLKTTPAALPRLLAFVRARHPYEEPELLVTEAAASEGYAAWVAAETA